MYSNRTFFYQLLHYYYQGSQGKIRRGKHLNDTDGQGSLLGHTQQALVVPLTCLARNHVIIINL